MKQGAAESRLLSVSDGKTSVLLGGSGIIFH